MAPVIFWILHACVWRVVHLVGDGVELVGDGVEQLSSLTSTVDRSPMLLRHP